MRARSALGAGLAVIVVLSAPAAAYAADNSREPVGISPTTQADAVAAMHGEAYAYAAYRAYAAKAADAQLGTVARLFRKTARQERYDHFAGLARLTGLVGSDVDNLTDAIAGERYEASVMYPAFARQAQRDGCTAAAEVFTELSGDEKLHAQRFAAARDALTSPDADQQFPVGERIPAGPIPAGSPRCTGQTSANLNSAMHGEAFANLKYALYAGHAQSAGHPRLARLFRDARSQELNEHFAEEAALAGLVRSTEENLRTAVAGEQQEATTTYPAYCDRAAQHGDADAAQLFHELAQDEATHASQFAALSGSAPGRHPHATGQPES